jgi:lipid-A-disaccharide synthase-like uncharacterized protein
MMLSTASLTAPVYEIHIQPELSGVKKIEIVYADEDAAGYTVEYHDGHVESLTPAQFTSLVVKDQNNRNWLKTIFNITSPFGMIWVAVGLLGQVLFTGRMIVQWIASEKSKRSVVPTAFWWMSLIGASMLITYFIWRKDVVGVLGQATGWGIYVRNLYLIYAHKKAAQLGEVPDHAKETTE